MRILNLIWRKHQRGDEIHEEYCAPCGCAYHPEPKPHVHPCDAHRPKADALKLLRRMLLYAVTPEAEAVNLELIAEVRTLLEGK